MAKTFFALAALSNWLSIYTNVDALQIKRNIGWYVRGYRNNKDKSFEIFCKKMQEHPLVTISMIINTTIDHGAGLKI